MVRGIDIISNCAACPCPPAPAPPQLRALYTIGSPFTSIPLVLNAAEAVVAAVAEQRSLRRHKDRETVWKT